jgi:hypothetical protein
MLKIKKVPISFKVNGNLKSEESRWPLKGQVKNAFFNPDRSLLWYFQIMS